jgi:3-hydroxy-9,10-secoandrosta-1,3,5(10)-triene-9,17-dione monooxygenase
MTAVMRHNYSVLEEYVRRGETPPMAERMLFKYQAANTATRAADLAAKLYRVVGGTGLFTSHPFSRMYDDIVAARQHQFNQDSPLAENYGAFLMGRENADFFI